MTVIGRDLYSDEMDPRRRYRASSCPRCGAETLDAAKSACRPIQIPSGDYECPGDTGCLDPFGVKWDLSGRACVIVNRDAKLEARELDAWIRSQLAGGDR